MRQITEWLKKREDLNFAVVPFKKYGKPYEIKSRDAQSVIAGNVKRFTEYALFAK